MLDRIESLENELRDVEIRLGDPAVQSDPRQLADLGRRFKQLEAVVAVAQRLRSAADDIIEFKEMLSATEGDERDEMRAEIEQLEAQVVTDEEQLRVLLLPPDPNDGRNVILEIRGAAGGEEANLFAKDLFDMFESFAKRQGWRMEVMSASHSDLGGFSEVTAMLSGDAVWTRMKHEAGTHRVQRVPVTESQGRVHTSSATVLVIPEADEVEVDVDDNDLRIDTYRASGPGGQSVNTMDSAVRITHLPTGVVVSMQDEKSQLKNKDKALRVLKSRLLQLEQEKADAEAAALRGSQVGSGDRSEKIRTYNYKENRVTDHRIGLTIHKLDRIVAGDLDEISDALIAEERRRQLEDDECATAIPRLRISKAPSPGPNFSQRPPPASNERGWSRPLSTPVASSKRSPAASRASSTVCSTPRRPCAASPRSTDWSPAARTASPSSTSSAGGDFVTSISWSTGGC